MPVPAEPQLPDDAAPRLATWLADEVEASVSAVAVTRLAAGHSSGAWKLDVTSDRPVGPLVLKAPQEPSVVYRRDACREGRIIEALAGMGAPVPPVLALDPSGDVLGRPCFVMAFVEGRTLEDALPGGFHADEWLQASPPHTQRAVWEAFHDGLAAIHAVDPAKAPDASHGPGGLTDVLRYWRAALLDVADAAAVPRQLAVLDWLGANLPPGADDDPAVCMGDARIVNCLLDGPEVRALVDFEVAYTGNPAADIGYSLFMSARQRADAPSPLPGIPPPDETWARWGRATGRATADRDFWTAFGATVLVITASRAMVQWGLAGSSLDESNPLVRDWEAAADRAAGR